jgi:hypothetical protein
MNDARTSNTSILAVRDATVGGDVWHVLGDAPDTACGRLGGVHTRLAQEVPSNKRCCRFGCRQRWPDYREPQVTDPRPKDSSAIFDLKCAICGHRETLEVQGGDPDGPSCSKCYGPMTVQGVAILKDQSRARRRGL